MKKTILFLITLVLIALTVISCSNTKSKNTSSVFFKENERLKSELYNEISKFVKTSLDLQYGLIRGNADDIYTNDFKNDKESMKFYQDVNKSYPYKLISINQTIQKVVNNGFVLKVEISDISNSLEERNYYQDIEFIFEDDKPKINRITLG